MNSIPDSYAGFVRELVGRTVPLGQLGLSPAEAVRSANLGLGFVYYSLVRILRPGKVVVVGSYRGFSVVCLAIGLRHNGTGSLEFVDASTVDGFWRNRDRVRRHFEHFGVADVVALYNCTTAEYVATSESRNATGGSIDLLLLDGDHTLEGVRADFESLVPRVREGGLICLHDSLAGGLGKTRLEVAAFLASLHWQLGESLSFECGKGLTILKKTASYAQLASEASDLVGDAGELNLGGPESSAASPDREAERLFAIRYRYLLSMVRSMTRQIEDLKRDVKRMRRRRKR